MIAYLKWKFFKFRIEQSQKNDYKQGVHHWAYNRTAFFVTSIFSPLGLSTKLFSSTISEMSHCDRNIMPQKYSCATSTTTITMMGWRRQNFVSQNWLPQWVMTWGQSPCYTSLFDDEPEGKLAKPRVNWLNPRWI